MLAHPPGYPEENPVSQDPTLPLQAIETDRIDLDPYQSRRRENAVALAQLLESITAHGLLEPVRLRRSRENPDRYWVYAGGRRVQAFRELAARDPERWGRI